MNGSWEWAEREWRQRIAPSSCGKVANSDDGSNHSPRVTRTGDGRSFYGDRYERASGRRIGRCPYAQRRSTNQKKAGGGWSLRPFLKRVSKAVQSSSDSKRFKAIRPNSSSVSDRFELRSIAEVWHQPVRSDDSDRMTGRPIAPTHQANSSSMRSTAASIFSGVSYCPLAI